MKIEHITIETVRFKHAQYDNVIILWDEEGCPHTLPDVDGNVAYVSRLLDSEEFTIVTDGGQR